MGDFAVGAVSTLLIVLLAAGVHFLTGPFVEKIKCQSELPRHVQCTYQPPNEVNHE